MSAAEKTGMVFLGSIVSIFGGILGAVVGASFSWATTLAAVENNTQRIEEIDKRFERLDDQNLPAVLASIQAELKQMNHRLGRIEQWQDNVND